MRVENKRYDAAALGICLVTVFGLLFFVQAINGMYSDDLFYASFWTGSLPDFFAKVAEHFRTYNGRVLVHLFPQFLLAFPMWVNAIFMTGVLVFIGAVGARWQGGSKSAYSIAVGTLLFGAQILIIGINTLREGLLWTSAAYNYVFPIALVLAACFLWEQWLENGKVVRLLWLLPLQFLCAATTEQCGVMTIAGTVLVGAGWLRRNTARIHRSGVVLLAPLMNVAGYITLFLSPATQERAVARMHFNLEFFRNMIPKWAEFYMSQKAILPIFIIFCIVFGIISFRRGWRLLSTLFGFALAAGLVVVGIFGSGSDGAAVLFVAFLLYAFVAAIMMLGEERYRKSAILLLTGLISAVIMLPTGTFGYRITTPFALVITLVNVTLVCNLCKNALQSGQRTWKTNILLVAIPLICALCFTPVVRGYWSNHLLDKKNAIEVAEAKTSGVLYYNIDYNPIYGYTRMYEDGYSQKSFLELYGLENCELYLTSDITPSIYVGEQRMSSLCVIEDGVAFFPVAQIIRALGGTVDWSHQQTVFTLDTLTVTELDENLYCQKSGEEWTVPLGKDAIISNDMKFYSAELMANVFGLAFQESDGVYRLVTE